MGQVETQRSNESIAKDLRYFSLRSFIKKNTTSLSTLGVSQNDLTEEHILITHFLTILPKFSVQFAPKRSYTQKRFLSTFKRALRTINRSLGSKSRANNFIIKFLASQIIDTKLIIVAELNLKKTVSKPKKFSKIDKARHRRVKDSKTLEIFGFLFDSSEQSVRHSFKNANFLPWLLTQLRLESKKEYSDLRWNEKFKDIIKNKRYEITEVSLSKTDINRRDRLRIVPSDPATLPYLISQLESANILINPDLSYIDQLKVRLPGKSPFVLKFKKINDVSIEARIRESSLDELKDVKILYELLGFKPDQILSDSQKDFLNDIFDDIGIKKSVPGWGAEKYSSYGVLDQLKQKKLVGISPIYNCRCTSPMHKVKWFIRKKKLKRCPDCKLSKHIFCLQWKSVSPNYQKISRKIVSLLSSEGYSCKIRHLTAYSKRYDFIAAKHSDKESFLFFNENGITQRISEDFLLDARPYVILDFIGELDSSLPTLGHIRGGSVLRSILNNQSDVFINEINTSFKRFNDTRLPSLQNSLSKLIQIRDTNLDSTLPQASKGVRFEKLIRPCFSLLFNAKHLGSRNRPDGIFFLNNSEYVLWDSKRYDSPLSNLFRYVKQHHKNLSKDICYIKAALAFDKILSRNLKYYIFITKSIAKEDFLRAKEYLVSHSRGRVSKVKIIGLDFRAIIVLAETMSNASKRDIIQKERERFLSEFDSLLNSNDFIDETSMRNFINKFEHSEVEAKMPEESFTKS